MGDPADDFLRMHDPNYKGSKDNESQYNMRCKKCGAEQLVWIKSKNKWRLSPDGRELHKCEEK